MKGAGGEIVQVQGGHIVRSTGRKDRHSKVYTAKGTRDRRVRLSAHTAIQFYDVQDRLGYDRPSKAVDWLIKKAKSAIDKLAELPPWHPPDSNVVDMDADQNVTAAATAGGGGEGSGDMGLEHSESSGYSFQIHRQLSGGGDGENMRNDSSFITPNIDPDTMKSLFPTSSTNSSMNFQNYSTHHDHLLSGTEDLGLSLHSFQDQALIHAQSADSATHHHTTSFSSAVYEPHFQRMLAAAGGGSTSSGGVFLFNHPSMQAQAALLGHDQSSAFSQRGPLQSSFTQSFRAWNDLTMASSDHNRVNDIHQSFIFGSRFAPEGLPAYNIPARIHGEEEQSVVSDRPSSSSPNSQH